MINISDVCRELEIAQTFSRIVSDGYLFQGRSSVLFNSDEDEKECVVSFSCIGCNFPGIASEDTVDVAKKIISVLRHLGFDRLVLESGETHEDRPGSNSWNCSRLDSELISRAEKRVPGLKFRLNWKDKGGDL